MAASTQTTNDDLPVWFRKILVPIVGLVLVLFAALAAGSLAEYGSGN